MFIRRLYVYVKMSIRSCDVIWPPQTPIKITMEQMWTCQISTGKRVDVFAEYQDLRMERNWKSELSTRYFGFFRYWKVDQLFLCGFSYDKVLYSSPMKNGSKVNRIFYRNIEIWNLFWGLKIALLVFTLKVTTYQPFLFERNSVDDSVWNWHHLTILCIGNQFQCSFISKYDRIISNSFVQIYSSLKFESLSLRNRT